MARGIVWTLGVTREMTRCMGHSPPVIASVEVLSDMHKERVKGIRRRSPWKILWTTPLKNKGNTRFGIMMYPIPDRKEQVHLPTSKLPSNVSILLQI